MVEEGRGVLLKEIEPQKGAKVAKTTQTKSLGDGAPGDKGRDLRTRVPNWTPPLVLDGSPFLANSSIRDFQKEKAGYVADAVKQDLLLPKDMVDLRTMKKQEVCLRGFFFLFFYFYE